MGGHCSVIWGAYNPAFSPPPPMGGGERWGGLKKRLTKRGTVQYVSHHGRGSLLNRSGKSNALKKNLEARPPARPVRAAAQHPTRDGQSAEEAKTPAGSTVVSGGGRGRNDHQTRAVKKIYRISSLFSSVCAFSIDEKLSGKSCNPVSRNPPRIPSNALRYCSMRSKRLEMLGRVPLCHGIRVDPLCVCNLATRWIASLVA